MLYFPDYHWTLACFVGFLLYQLLFKIFKLFMWVAFKCEALGNHDFSFLLDQADNQHIIVGAGIIEKFDFVTMKQYCLEKCMALDKCQSKLVKKCGLYWFQKMTE